jgi:hypothetical protein
MNVTPEMVTLLPAQWQQQIASSSLPVLLPRDKGVITGGTLDVQRTAFTLSSSVTEFALTVRGDALTQQLDGSAFAVVERAAPDGRPTFQVAQIAGRSVIMAQSAGVLSARWAEDDVLYSVEVRCTSDTCNAAAYLTQVIASLEFAGGGDPRTR